MAKILHIRHPSTRTPTECCYCALYPHTLTQTRYLLYCSHDRCSSSLLFVSFWQWTKTEKVRPNVAKVAGVEILAEDGECVPVLETFPYENSCTECVFL